MPHFVQTHKKWIVLYLALLILTPLIIWQLSAQHSAKNNSSTIKPVLGVQNNSATDLLSEVGALVDLPTGENPKVLTVTQVENLRAQPFYMNAENGDKVLIYQNAKKAYLYRPSTKKVINIAPIEFQATPTPTIIMVSDTPTPTASSSATTRRVRKTPTPKPTRTPTVVPSVTSAP